VCNEGLKYVTDVSEKPRASVFKIIYKQRDCLCIIKLLVFRNIYEDSEETFETPPDSRCCDGNSILFPPEYKTAALELYHAW
jgi:hypothetical protein